MNDKNMEYLKNQDNQSKMIRTEILLTPLLVITPMFIGSLFIYDWCIRGFLENDPSYFGTLILGIIILVGNILFDIPFIKSLRELSKNK